MAWPRGCVTKRAREASFPQRVLSTRRRPSKSAYKRAVSARKRSLAEGAGNASSRFFALINIRAVCWCSMRRPPFLAVFHCSGDVFIVPQDRGRSNAPVCRWCWPCNRKPVTPTAAASISPIKRWAKGPQDLVFVHGWASNIEVYQEEPAFVRFVSRLTSFARVILFDKRGTGLSDRVGDMPSLEVRMDDVRAVMDAVDSERAALFGVSEGGTMCALFSATYPQRTTALIMHGSFPRRTRAADYPFGPTEEEMQLWIARLRREWGGPVGLAERAPSMVGDERFSQWWGRMLRMAVKSGRNRCPQRNERRNRHSAHSPRDPRPYTASA